MPFEEHDQNEPGESPESFEQHWRRRFTRFAGRHEDDASIAGWSRFSLEARLRLFLRLWEGAGRSGRWLDIGCGAGTYTRLLAGQELEVVGVDYSVPTLVKARARCPGGIRWVAGSATSLPVASASSGGLLCFGVLQALSRSEDALAEFARIVVAGGSVWIDALNAWCLPHLWEMLAYRLRRRPRHLRYEGPVRIRRLMRRHGIEVVRFAWMPILPGSWQRFQPWVESSLGRWIFRWVPGAGLLFSHAFLVCGAVRGGRAGCG